MLLHVASTKMLHGQECKVFLKIQNKKNPTIPKDREKAMKNRMLVTLGRMLKNTEVYELSCDDYSYITK